MLRDREPPPRPGQVNPRLALRLTYRAGRTRAGAARRGRRCARSRIRATVVPRRGTRVLDPELARHVDFILHGHRLRRDFSAPFSRAIRRRLMRYARVYRVRAKVRLGDGRIVRVARRFRYCGPG
jgi:hypothetical protein